MEKHKIFFVGFMSLIFILSGGREALASSYATNFDNLVLGEVHGQEGWTSGHGSSICPLYDVAVVPNTYGYNTFGANSLRISNAITCGSFNDMTFSSSLTDEAGESSAPNSTFSGGSRQPYFEAEWSFAPTLQTAQPNLSVVASPNRGDTMRMSWLQMLDTNDNETGLTLNFEDYQHSISNFVTTPIATHLDRTIPHKIKITIQFIDGPSNDIVNIYLDGSLIHTGTTWEDYYRDFAGGQPFAVDSIMFRTAGTAVPSTLGKGFLIDNFSSLTGPLPTAPIIILPIAPTAVGKRDGMISVVKTVINDNGGTKTVSDFPLFVGGTPVISGEINNFAAPHDGYSIAETSDPNYVQTFSGDCDENGRLNITPGQNQFCMITNNDIGQSATTTPISPLIDVVIVSNPPNLLSDHGQVQYTYTLRNIGTVPATDIALASNTFGPINFISGDTNADSKLDVNEVWTYTSIGKLSETHTTTVVATGHGNGLTAIDTANSMVVVGAPTISPTIHIIKVPINFSPLPSGGGAIVYSYSVNNPGAVSLSNIVITDDKCAKILGPYGDSNANGMLDPNEKWAYSCFSNILTTTTNTAMVTGEANGLTARDIAVATVVVTPPAAKGSLIVNGKNIIPIFNRSLSLGMKGDDVTLLQNILIEKGLLRIPIGVQKGYFGQLTQAALAKYQTSVGLPAVGIFGPLTRAKIIL